MRKWALTTVVKVEPDQYTENIWPLTAPIFAEYAERHGMDFRPTWVNHSQCAWMIGTRAGNLGTSAVYSSIPARRELLAAYAGVVYIDQDAVILDMERDISREVSDEQPVGMANGLTGALMVLKNGTYTRGLLAECWAARDQWKPLQWAEEGYFKHRFGWDHIWEHGEPAQFLGETEDTRYLRLLPFALKHPFDTEAPEGRYFASNPGGIQPFERRLDVIHRLLRERESAIHGS